MDDELCVCEGCNAVPAKEEDKQLDEDWVQENLPGFTLEEAMALSAAGLHSATDQTSTLAKTQALTQLTEWVKADPMNAKRLVFMRREYGNKAMELAQRVVEGAWSDTW